MTAMISLQNVSKSYPGASRPAVQSLDLDIARGEILVLLGPSGCGKTTTLEMINRLVTPSTGTIRIGGEDTSTLKTTELRRRIGYVIQDAGLFPHRTVAQNIATVPELLKWDRKRITARVDELLEMVHLDPAAYRDRLPSELSGGQRQRIGVARALAADPDVILMDEPFGALDPITREHLQSEFLRLQREIHKTIVFVTHDIDEAVRMGDRIAVFGTDSRIAQLDTPMGILTRPASDYVRDFIGGDATMRALSLIEVPAQGKLIETQSVAIVGEGDPAPETGGTATLLITDEHGRPRRWAEPGASAAGAANPAAAGARPALIASGSTMRDAVGVLLSCPEENPRAAVVDEGGRAVGVLTLADVQHAVARSGLTSDVAVAGGEAAGPPAGMSSAGADAAGTGTKSA